MLDDALSEITTCDLLTPRDSRKRRRSQGSVTEDDGNSDCELGAANHTECPLCAIDDVEPEYDGAMMNGNPTIRRIMSTELVWGIQRPSKYIYDYMAEMYNRKIRATYLKAGHKCAKWTGALVKVHFEQHVTLLPRREAGDAYARAKRMCCMIEQDIMCKYEETGEMDTKLVASYNTIARLKMDTLKEHSRFHLRDLTQTGATSLWRSVDMGDTGVKEAKLILDKMALIKNTAGYGDRPMASTLFQD